MEMMNEIDELVEAMGLEEQFVKAMGAVDGFANVMKGLSFYVQMSALGVLVDTMSAIDGRITSAELVDMLSKTVKAVNEELGAYKYEG